MANVLHFLRKKISYGKSQLGTKLALTVFLFGIGLYFYLWVSRNDGLPEGQQASQHSKNGQGISPASPQEQSQGARAQVKTPGKHLNAAGKRDHPSRVGDPNDIFHPVTDAEADWLDKHGFPDSIKSAELASAPIGELKKASDSGDTAAKTELGKRLSTKPSAEYGDPLQILREAAIEGSVYALSILGDICSTNPAYKDIELARAYYLVSSIRGNYKGIISSWMLEPQLSRDRVLFSSFMAVNLYGELNAAHIREFGVPFDNDQRDGMDAILSDMQSNDESGATQ